MRHVTFSVAVYFIYLFFGSGRMAFKGKVHLEIEIISLTHPNVIAKLYD